MVAHTVVRLGMPPTAMSPGIHVVTRSGGRNDMSMGELTVSVVESLNPPNEAVIVELPMPNVLAIPAELTLAML